ncbi:MAG: capsule assembly Wzi family protein [Gemmatimonadaceae bacterium]
MRLRHAAGLLVFGAGLALSPLEGQEAVGLDLGGTIQANGEAERYLRVLQLLGQVPEYPVAIRPWSRLEARRLVPTSAHPWAARFAAADSTPHRLRLLRPEAGFVWNSTMPEGTQPEWLGRGATLRVAGGVRFSRGVLSVQIAPRAYWSQNASFPLAPNGLSGDAAVRDARFPAGIDAPQRFGTQAFARVDADMSQIAVDTRAASFGFSTAPLAWGPARDEPLVIGPNAGGFPHAYIQSGSPWPIGIGHLHVKLIAGRLEQSEWSPMQSGDRSRFLSAAVISLQPRGAEGLELGVVRASFQVWQPGTATLKNTLRPFTGILSNPTKLLNETNEDGYASVFFRWSIAPAGFEVYGEYGREDYSGTVRGILEKPDDLGNLLLGAQRATHSSSGTVRVYRAELINAELSANERGQRGFTRPVPPYTHFRVRQGVTVNGQVLGSATAYGGAGWRAARDVYSSAGRESIIVERRLVKDWLPVAAGPEGRAPEVRYGARYERLRFRAKGRELGGGVGVSYTLNRNTVPGDDSFNLQVAVQWRGL